MSIFQYIKEEIQFSDLAHEYGLRFNQNNKANCPFHEDHTPSFHNFGTHGYCFGCNKIADIIDLEAYYKGLKPFRDIRTVPDLAGIPRVVAARRRE